MALQHFFAMKSGRRSTIEILGVKPELPEYSFFTTPRLYLQTTDSPLTANERTFLGYLRTSSILSMLGIFIAQFYRLQQAPDPPKTFGYYALSIPLSTIFQAAALVTVLLGGLRYWRQQSAMARGRVHAGGFEMVVLGVGFLLVSRSPSLYLDVGGESVVWLRKATCAKSPCWYSCYLCCFACTSSLMSRQKLGHGLFNDAVSFSKVNDLTATIKLLKRSHRITSPEPLRSGRSARP